MNRFSDKEKQLFLGLKVLCRFIDNLQSTNSTVKLLQCYGIFLTSRNLTCTTMKNTPQSRNDLVHQRTLRRHRRLYYIIGAGMESILQSCVLA